MKVVTPTLEYMPKLHEGVLPGEVPFSSPFVEFRDCLINGEFDAVFAVILVDFNATFDMQINALDIVIF
jgi:hypothetical protein